MNRRTFLAALGVGQIASWGTLYYSFPLLAIPMEEALGASRTSLYLAPTLGMLVGALAAFPVGVAIDRGYGRTVMAAGALLAAVLLVGWSRVETLPLFYALFAGLGVAQAMTLYDPAFAVVARRYGTEARAGITSLTLWGGFASTVFVPVVQGLLTVMSWRDTLLVLAGVNLLLCAPLYGAAINRRKDAPLPGAPPAPQSTDADADAPPPGKPTAWAVRQPVFWLLAAAFTLYYGTFSALTYHIYPLLLERGLSAQAVVGAIALIGPAQVAGRLTVWMLMRHRSVRVVGSATVAAMPVALGLLMLADGPVALVVFALLYGASNGVMTIVRGVAVPELVTRESYGTLNGMINAPQTAAKALAPVAVAGLWTMWGSYGPVTGVILAVSLVVAALFWTACALRSEPVITPSTDAGAGSRSCHR